MESELVTSISLCSLFKFLNTGFCLGFPQWWTVNYKTKTNKQTKEPFLLNWTKEQVNVRLRRRWSIYFNPCHPVRFREYFLLSSSHLSLYMCICVCVCAYMCVCVCPAYICVRRACACTDIETRGRCQVLLCHCPIPLRWGILQNRSWLVVTIPHDAPEIIPTPHS